MVNQEHRSPNPFAGDRTTPWAFASLLCSLTFFCPVATVIGPLLGFKALAEIRKRPGTTGRSMAIIGIALGTAASVGWLAALLWWDHEVRRPIIGGPVATLEAGFQGDLERFRSGFFGPAAATTDEEVIAFLGELSRRYGRLHGLEQGPPREAQPGGWGVVNPIVPYVAHFDDASVELEAEFVLQDPGATGLIRKWRWIIVYDELRGDIAFPSSAFDLKRAALERLNRQDEDHERRADH